MSMIPDEIIEQVRDGADLVSIIGETVELKRTGGDYRGPCPFHGGQHRNFAVIPKKGRYYCFVCKASGDVFSWYMQRLGLDYPTAVREAARKLGITIPETGGRQGPDPREPLYQAVAVAHDWFARQLRENPEAEDARRYAQGRGLESETVELLELGYAPRGMGFVQAMAQLGLDEGRLLEAGILARREDGSVIPRFRGRLLFPIHDLRGRVVGFGGRLLGPGEPKYLNSPETPIFKKGGTLYNLYAARNAIRKEESVILVEGYFDVLRLVLAGCENVVAPMGTALTPDQAALLRRYAPLAVLLLDSDMAGLKATFRAGDELLRHEMRVRVASMPPGEDPDTLVRKGGIAALQPILKDAADLMERKIRILELKGWFADVEHRREALDRLLPTIRAARDPIQRELYLSLVAEKSGVDKKVLEHEAAQPGRGEASEASPQPAAGGRAAPPEPRPDPRVRWGRTERQLLRLLLASEQWRTTAVRGLSPELFRERVHREMFERLRGPAIAGTAAPPEDAPDPLRLRWQSYLDAGPPVVEGAIDQFYADAANALESRPHLERLLAIRDELSRAAPARVGDLMLEQRALKDLLGTRFTKPYHTMYPLLRGARRTRGAPPGRDRQPTADTRPPKTDDR
jgi:DNA primase